MMVAAGGASGALLRWGLGSFIGALFGGAHWGTLSANLIGCFFIGLAHSAVTLADWGSPDMRLFLFTGLIGAFTTYSTFNHHMIDLWSQNRSLVIVYLFTTLIGGYVFYMLAQSLGNKLFT